MISYLEKSNETQLDRNIRAKDLRERGQAVYNNRGNYSGGFMSLAQNSSMRSSSTSPTSDSSTKKMPSLTPLNTSQMKELDITTGTANQGVDKRNGTNTGAGSNHIHGGISSKHIQYFYGGLPSGVLLPESAVQLPSQCHSHNTSRSDLLTATGDMESSDSNGAIVSGITSHDMQSESGYAFQSLSYRQSQPTTIERNRTASALLQMTYHHYHHLILVWMLKHHQSFLILMLVQVQCHHILVVISVLHSGHL